MLSNAYFLAKFRFDTAENEPAKNLQNFARRPGEFARNCRKIALDQSYLDEDGDIQDPLMTMADRRGIRTRVVHDVAPSEVNGWGPAALLLRFSKNAGYKFLAFFFPNVR